MPRKPPRRGDTEVIIPDRHAVRAAKALSKEYNFDNCPAEYEAIKQQAIALYRMSGYAFVLMAHRLTVIRDGRMYRDDGYKNFESFLNGELAVSRSTAYNFISLLEVFGKTLELVSARFPYRRLLKAVPLLTSPELKENPRVYKSVRHKLIHCARDEEHAAFDKLLKTYRDKYGASDTPSETTPPPQTSPLEKAVTRLLKLLPENPNRKERALLRSLKNRLEHV